MSESLQPSTVDSKCFLISTCFLFLQLLLSASVDTSHKSAQAQHHKASNLKTKLYFYPVIVSKHHRCLLPQPPPPLPPLSILSLLYCFPQLFSRFYGAVDPRKWYCLPLKWMFSMFLGHYPYCIHERKRTTCIVSLYVFILRNSLISSWPPWSSYLTSDHTHNS